MVAMVAALTASCRAGCGDSQPPDEPVVAQQPDAPAARENTSELVVRDGVTIHAPTGLIAAPGYQVVAATCTACHSARLVTQNRLTRSGWAELLRWMQKNHNLWALPDTTRATILDYLAAQYGVPEAEDLRRPPLPSYLMPPTKAELARSREPAMPTEQ